MAAGLLIGAGAVAFGLGVWVLARFRPYRFRGLPGGLDPPPDFSVLRRPEARAALEELRRDHPEVAAETIDALRRFDELEDKAGAFSELRRFVRLMRVVSWAAVGLVLLGAFAVVAGIRWLG